MTNAELRSEAAIYAQGTTYTTDDLVQAWHEHGSEDERLQDFFERYTAGHEVVAPSAIGVYFLHPEGSGWIAVEFDGGQIVSRTEESNADTHAAARDSWAGVVPSDDDAEVSGNEALAIIAAAMGDDTDAEMVIVTKR